ncbi:late embryogenesis abundant protein-like protein [Carex littledalei]|uniref:Late embryogenesis abundant protein-like protein n=1 Tax=Carex littledalei TaxID=544730 RepID=A0A833QWV1_9POAL|nr:late embryogenesis abundant protein-like protein [Carex littledalei]
MQSAKEKSANAAASAKAGMEKTKASVDEKGDKMKTRDPMEKGAAEQHKEERKMGAETEKQGEKQVNAANTGGVTGHHPTGGFGSGV